MTKESKSYAELAFKIGYAKTGGSGTQAVKEMIEFYNIDISHFTGQGWNKGNYDYGRFDSNNYIKPKHAFEALVNLRSHKCEECGNSEWNNQQIPLEVHHIDGNHLNNSLENLLLLCPNCHALTKNYKNKNRKNINPIADEDFVEMLKNSASVRQALLNLGLSGSGGNYARAYDLINKHNIHHLIKTA